MTKKLPKITKKDLKILQLHWAGKKMGYIARKFSTTRKYIAELIEKTGKGYRTS
jgi:transcriptional regulator